MYNFIEGDTIQIRLINRRKKRQSISFGSKGYVVINNNNEECDYTIAKNSSSLHRYVYFKEKKIFVVYKSCWDRKLKKATVTQENSDIFKNFFIKISLAKTVLTEKTWL